LHAARCSGPQKTFGPKNEQKTEGITQVEEQVRKKGGYLKERFGGKKVGDWRQESKWKKAK